MNSRDEILRAVSQGRTCLFSLVGLVAIFATCVIGPPAKANALLPVVMVHSPITGSAYLSPPLSIEYSISDGIAPYEVRCRIDSNPYIDPCPSGTTVSSLEDGAHQLLVEVTDSIGSQGSEVTVFLTDFPDAPVDETRDEMPSWLGYSFKNKSIGPTPEGSFSQDLVLHRSDIVTDEVAGKVFFDVTMSGVNNVATTIKKELWKKLSKKEGAGGSCFGLALTGARFHQSVEPLRSTFDGRTSSLWAVSSTRQLLAPMPGQHADLSNGAPVGRAYGTEMLRHLAAAHLSQYSTEVQSTIVSQKRAMSDSSADSGVLRGLIDTAINTGSSAPYGEVYGSPGGLVQIWMLDEGRGGHAVVAYDVRERSAGGFFIDVWDNNSPDEEQTIVVNENGSWRYQASYGLDYSGDPHAAGEQRGWVLAAPNFSPRGLHYLPREGEQTEAILSFSEGAAVSEVVVGGGGEVWRIPTMSQLGVPAGGSLMFDDDEGSLAVQGADPSVSVRAKDGVMVVDPDETDPNSLPPLLSSDDELRVHFAGNKMSADNGQDPATFRIWRTDGYTISSSGTNSLAAPPGGQVRAEAAGDGPVTIQAEDVNGETRTLLHASIPDGDAVVISDGSLKLAFEPVESESAGGVHVPAPSSKPTPAIRFTSSSVRRGKSYRITTVNVADGTPIQARWRPNRGRAVKQLAKVKSSRIVLKAPRLPGRYSLSLRLGGKRIGAFKIRVR